MAGATVDGSRYSLVNKDNAIVTARPYQVQLFEQALKSNKIIYLGTGAGKTFIAVLLIKEMALAMKGLWEEGAKRTIFLANTVALVKQQAKYIANLTPFKVSHYVGEMGVDFWQNEKWTTEFQNNEVLAMSAQIFLDILMKNYITIDRVHLLIMDECHHAAIKSKHPMHEVMRQVYERCEGGPAPRILGLTASVINKKIKIGRLPEYVEGLECIMMGRLAKAVNLEEAWNFSTKSEEIVLCYDDPTHDKSIDCTLNMLCYNFGQKQEKLYNDLKQVMQWVTSIFTTMGTWGALKGIEILLQEEEDSDDREEVVNLLTNIKRVFEEPMIGYSETERLFLFRTKKLEKLVEVILDYPKKKLYGIVFVEQRFFCKVLCAYLKAMFEFTNPEDPIQIQWIVGGSRHSFLKSVEEEIRHQGAKAVNETGILSSFRRHELNLLIATSILEEGLDVPKCNLVLRYDLPKEFRSYVQSRGRARADPSRYIIMVQNSELGKLTEELILYRNIEKNLKQTTKHRPPLQEKDIADAFDDLCIPHYQPYGERGPKITAISSFSVLYKYCSMLSHDRFSNPVPIWRCYENGKVCRDPGEENTDDFFEHLDFEDKDNSKEDSQNYMYEMAFPIISPIKCFVRGPEMKSKRMAQFACGLLACEVLHKHGELDDNHLQPIDHRESSEDDSDEDEKERDSKAKSGTTKRRRYHRKAVPEELCNINLFAFKPILYGITLKMENPIAKSLNPRQYKIFHPEKSDQFLGILTDKRIPQLEPFLLYTRWGEVSVTLEEISTDVTIDDFHYTLFANFHFWMFQKLLSFSEEEPFLRATPRIYLVIPLTRGNGRTSIDIDLLIKVERNLRYDFHKPRNQEEVAEFIFEEEKYKDAVLCATYMDPNNPSFRNVQKYTVEEVCHGKNPTSKFPNKNYSSFKEYYHSKYGVKVVHRQQPLLKCEIFNHRLNVLVPRIADDSTYEEGRTKKSTIAPSILRDCPYIIPELCRIHLLPASLYRQVLWIPSILKRVSALLTSNALRKRIAAETNVGSLEPPPSGYIPKKLNFYEDVDLQTHPGPTASTILQAFTPSKTCEAFDLERFEMIGDSFLKMAASIACFMKSDHIHEGRLTSNRSKIISNKNLYLVAVKKGLTGLVNAPLFIPRKNWVPPGYQARKTIEEALMAVNVPDDHWNVAPILDQLINMEKKEIMAFVGKEHIRLKKQENEKPMEADSKRIAQLREWQLLSDKSIADSVEALIGAYLLSCGPKATLRVLCWLGLPILEGDPPEYVPFSAPENGLCRNVDPTFVNRHLDKLTLKLDELEHIVGYQFQTTSFLVQAMTHGSYDRNRVTNSYERLEFLGDAVLDYLITWHIYHLDKQLSPGDLTDLRSALVNNVAFGALAIKWKLHQHLKHTAPPLQKAIIRFCELQEESNYEVDEVWCYVKENASNELEEIEVPKVLGDIFESLAGAIFLDTKMDLKEVWRVFEPVLQPLIDKFKENIPKNPIREVRELFPEVQFGESVITKTKLIQVTATINKKEFVGIGANRKAAKTAASQAALRTQKNKRKKKEIEWKKM